MYIDSFWPRKAWDNAKLNTPMLQIYGDMCLTFFYHMYGSGIEELRVIHNGNKTVLSLFGEKGKKWLAGWTTLSLSGMDMVRNIHMA